MSGAQRLGHEVYKLQGPAFLFNAIEDSKNETGKARQKCTTLQRNTLCQNSENMVWTRNLLPHWRHDADSAWLEICSVRARWDLHRKEERGCRSSTRDLLHGMKVFCQSFGTAVTNFIIAEAHTRPQDKSGRHCGLYGTRRCKLKHTRQVPCQRVLRMESFLLVHDMKSALQSL